MFTYLILLLIPLLITDRGFAKSQIELINLSNIIQAWKHVTAARSLTACSVIPMKIKKGTRNNNLYTRRTRLFVDERSSF